MPPQSVHWSDWQQTPSASTHECLLCNFVTNV
jgi:hypothetical protein